MVQWLEDGWMVIAHQVSHWPLQLRLCPRSCKSVASGQPTFEGHHLACLQVHLGTSPGAHLVHLVAQLVAAVLTAAEAQALVEGLLGGAAVGGALLLLVH